MGMLPHSNFRFWISDFGMNHEATVQNPNSKIQNSVVEVNGLEPMASCVQSRRSPSWATPPVIIADFRLRIFSCQNPKSKIQIRVVGLDGIEPSTSRLSGVRSNRTELQAPGYFGLRPTLSRWCAQPQRFWILDSHILIHSKIQVQKSKIRMSLFQDVREPHLISQN